jgi:hypothetical protein
LRDFGRRGQKAFAALPDHHGDQTGLANRRSLPKDAHRSTVKVDDTRTGKVATLVELTEEEW